MVSLTSRYSNERFAFNIYIAPVLEFVGQLVEPTEEVKDTIIWALRRLAPGLVNWITQTDLENLCCLGFNQEFRCIEHSARAAKLRVARDLVPNAIELKDALVMAFLEADQRQLGAWFRHCFTYILGSNFQARSPRAIEAATKNCTQAELVSLVKAEQKPYDAESRIGQ